MNSIFPNPAQEVLFIEVNENEEEFDFSLINAQGKVLRKGTNSSNNITTIDLTGLSQGLYLVLISNGKTEYQEKILVF